MEIAQNCFERCSIDLIYARQDQTPEAWVAELERAKTFGFEHMSLYQLTIEPGTAFGDRYKRGKLSGLPSDDQAAEMYAATLEICEADGLQRYEVSNYAVPGQESRHNLIYWNYGDYIGIGPGAHGRIINGQGLKTATETVLSPSGWLNGVNSGSVSHETQDVLTLREQSLERILMGLRLAQGTIYKRD